MRVRHPDGQAFTFDAGALCLELSSVSGGAGRRSRFELLHTPADLVRWAFASRLDPRSWGLGPADVVATADDLALVKRLREAIWAGAWALATGTAVAPEDAATINAVAGGTAPVPMIGPGPARAWPRPLRADRLVTLIARDAVVTLTPPAATRVRRCAAGDCALIYLDTSRPGNRRWCSMERCGNRAKVRAHRSREDHP